MVFFRGYLEKDATFFLWYLEKTTFWGGIYLERTTGYVGYISLCHTQRINATDIIYPRICHKGQPFIGVNSCHTWICMVTQYDTNEVSDNTSDYCSTNMHFCWSFQWTNSSYPKHSMYGLFTYVYHILSKKSTKW